MTGLIESVMSRVSKSGLSGLGLRSPFTVPSGVVTTVPTVIARMAEAVPALGFLTTKTVSLEPRQGYREPIIYEYHPGCFLNAVGLANPGARGFLEAMKPLLPLHGGKPLLVSIMGGGPDEFLECARILDPIADAFELNLSCPHVKGAGQMIGSDPDAVRAIVCLLKANFDKPVIPKLSPNLPDVGSMALLCEHAGADALALINTTGPGMGTDCDGNPVLSNKVGGLSGAGVLPVGIRAVTDAAARVTIPIIASGGIGGAAEVRAYARAGASLFAVGSALAGMTTPEIASLFIRIVRDLEATTEAVSQPWPGSPDGGPREASGGGTTRLPGAGITRGSDPALGNRPPTCSESPRTAYLKTKIVSNVSVGDKMFRLTLENGKPCDPGQFFFLRLPEHGEKPFSPAADSPPSYLVRAVGLFTVALERLEPGAAVFMRGPYGQGFLEPAAEGSPVLVGGGTGVAPILMAASRWPDNIRACFLGFSRQIDPEFGAYLTDRVPGATVHIDKPESPGAVVRALARDMVKQPARYQSARIYVCGPKRMMEAVVDVCHGTVPRERIFLAREDLMRCGIGLCGSCGTEAGLRSCVDGPVMNPE